jgi:hypothetical protein
VCRLHISLLVTRAISRLVATRWTTHDRATPYPRCALVDCDLVLMRAGQSPRKRTSLCFSRQGGTRERSGTSAYVVQNLLDSNTHRMVNLITTGILQVFSGDRMIYRAPGVSDSAPNASNNGPSSVGRRDPFPASCIVRHGMTAQLLPFLLFDICHGVSRRLSDFWFTINLVLARTS